MKGGTLFSGIGVPELAMPWVDWRWCAEIDPFPSAVHAARFPGLPNLGDVTKVNWDAVGPVDLLVFGSPCQSFSVAGRRLGLDDPRGNLALVALGVARRIRARWLVFENVPGLLSSDGGRDFGAFLGLMGKCGFGYCSRVLDAQYFGLAQRRRRVFVVGYLGDWRPPAAVLLEPESLRGNPPPRREAGQGVAAGTGNGVANSLGAKKDGGWRGDLDNDTYVVGAVSAKWAKGAGGPAGDEAYNLVTHALRADGFDANADGQLAVAFHENQRAEITLNDTAGSLKVGGGKPGQGYPAVAAGMTVRRLTPLECERLQGLPDGWTAITYRGKPAADGHRYKAIGNAMPRPVLEWIGNRLRMVNEIVSKGAA